MNETDPYEQATRKVLVEIEVDWPEVASAELFASNPDRTAREAAVSDRQAAWSEAWGKIAKACSLSTQDAAGLAERARRMGDGDMGTPPLT